MAIKVSVIVPVYNVESFLDRCMESLLNQSLKEIEIILVNDGSTDSSALMCNNYANKDKRVKVIHKLNAGLGFARNSGIEVAKGEFIAFIDSDDFVDIETLKTLYTYAKDLKLDTVFCGYASYIDEKNISKNSEVENITVFENHQIREYFLKNMIANKPSTINERSFRMSVWHAIYSTKLINNNNIRFESEREFISEDILFHVDYLTHAFKIGVIPEVFYYYCLNNTNSLTKTFRSDRFQKQKLLFNELKVRLMKSNLLNEDYELRLKRFMHGYIRDVLRNISASQLTNKEKKTFIQEVFEDEIWNYLLNYPINEMPFKHRIIIILYTYKLYHLTIILFKFTKP